jgi:hypothetical protein
MKVRRCLYFDFFVLATFTNYWVSQICEYAPSHLDYNRLSVFHLVSAFQGNLPCFNLVLKCNADQVPMLFIVYLRQGKLKGEVSLYS